MFSVYDEELQSLEQFSELMFSFSDSNMWKI